MLLFWMLALPFQAARPVDDSNLPFKEGWYAGVHLGSQYYLSDFKFRKDASIGYGFSSYMEGYVGKWITSFLSLRGNVEYGNVTSGTPVYDSNIEEDVYVRTSFRMVHTSVDFIYDAGYLLKGHHTKYTACPLFSIGYGINTTDHEHGPSIAIGCIQTWRYNEHIHFNLETKLRMLDDPVNGHTDRNDGQLVINAGVSVAF